MDALFLYITKLSLRCCFIIPVVIFIRFCLKKCPKVYSYSLWILVFFQLIFSVNITVKSSATQKLPLQSVQEKALLQYENVLDNYTGEVQFYNDNTPEFDRAVANGMQPITSENSVYVATVADGLTLPATVKTQVLPAFSLLWFAGFCVLFCLLTKNILSLYSVLKFSEKYENGVFINEIIKSPFVFGFINPRIYLPITINKDEYGHIIAHEKIHIKRFDYLIKPLCFLICSLHWFNPLVWVSYFLMCRDMEMSCDEAVIKLLGSSFKKKYSLSLVNFAKKDDKTLSSAVFFGESDSENRIKNILKYKKPGKILTICLTVVIISCGIMFFISQEAQRDLPIVTNSEKTVQEAFTAQLEKVANLDGVTNKYRKFFMGEEFIDNEGKAIPGDFNMKSIFQDRVKQGFAWASLVGVRIDDKPEQTPYFFAFVSNESPAQLYTYYLLNNEVHTSDLWAPLPLLHRLETVVSYDVLSPTTAFITTYTTDFSQSHTNGNRKLTISKIYEKEKLKPTGLMTKISDISDFSMDIDTGSLDYPYERVVETYEFDSQDFGDVATRGLRFFNDKLGFACKANGYTEVPLARITLDGGKTWQDLDFSQLTYPEFFTDYASCCMDMYGETIEIRLKCKLTDYAVENKLINSTRVEPYYLISYDCGKTWAGYLVSLELGGDKPKKVYKKLTETLPTALLIAK